MRRAGDDARGSSTSGGFRARRWLPRVLAALSILFLAGYLAHRFLLLPWLGAFLERAVERSTGAGVAIGSMEGGWLGSIRVGEVRTVRPGRTGALVSVEIDELTAHYSLPALLRGVDTFVASATIEVDGARVVLSLAPPAQDRGGVAGSSPLALPALRLRSLDILARRPGLSLLAGGVTVDTGDALPAGMRELSIAAASLAAQTPQVEIGPVPLAARVRPTASRVEVELSVPGRSLRGSATYAGGVLDARAVLEAVALGSGVIRLPGGELSGTFSGDVRIRAGTGVPFAVDGWAKLEHGVAKGVPIERVDLKGGFAAGRLQMSSLEAASGANRISIRDAVVAWAPIQARDAVAAARAASGTFSARLADVPGLLALFDRRLPVAGQAPPHLVELEGTAGNGVVQVTVGRLALARGGVRVKHFRVGAPPGSKRWSQLQIDAAFEVALPDLALLNRTLPAPDLAGSLAGEVTIAGTPETLGGSLRATARQLEVGGRAIGDLNVDATAEAGRLLVRTASLAHAGGANRVSVDGVVLRATDLIDRRWRTLARDVSGRFAAQVRNLPALFALAARPFPPTVRLPSHLVQMKGRIGRGTIELAEAKAFVADARMELVRARATLPPEGRPWDGTVVDAALEADAPDLAALMAVLGRPSLQGRAHASAQMSGRLQNPRGAFAAQFDDAFLNGVGPVNGRIGGALSGGGIDLATLALETTQGGVALTGRLEREGESGGRLRLDTLVMTRGPAEARLERPVMLRYEPPGIISIGRLGVVGPQGSLVLAGRLSSNGGLDLGFDAVGIGSDGWLRGLVGERVVVRGVDVHGRLTGSRMSPKVQLQGAIAALGGTETPIRVSGRFDLAYEPGTLSVLALEWSDDKGLHASVAGRLPLDLLAERRLPPGPLDLTAHLEAVDLQAFSFLLPASLALHGELEADLALRGSWTEPSAEVAARVQKLELPGIAPLKGRAPLSGNLEASLHPGVMELRSLQVFSDEFTAEASGSWNGMPTPEELLRRARPLRSGTVALRLTFASVDLAILRAVAGNPRRLAGRLTGEASITGPAGDPTIEGELRLEEGALDSGGWLPPLERVTVVATVRGRAARIERASGEAAGAPFALGGGVAWGDDGLSFDLTLDGNNVLLYRDETVTARADLDLRARGPLAKLRIDGTVLLQNSVYSRTISLLDLLGRGRGLTRGPRGASGVPFSLREAPWRDLEFAVEIGTGSPFLIRSNLARGAVRPNLTLAGTGQLPVLSGNLFIDQTRVSLPAGTLVVDRGLVTFPQPGAGEPRIDVVGHTRLLGYEVTVAVGGTLRAPEVTLSSVPPLPDDELLLLVLAGTPPGTADAQAMKRILEANLARFVAESILERVAGRSGAVTDLAERIEVDIGRDVTRSGSATIETRFRLAGGTGSTGPVYYVTGGTDVYDTYTMGVTVVFRFR